MIQLTDTTTAQTPAEAPRIPTTTAQRHTGQAGILAKLLETRPWPQTKNQRLSERRFSVLEAGGFRCAFCGKDLLDDLDSLLIATVDHIVPKSVGGGNTNGNLVASCVQCNTLKGDAPTANLTEARRFVAERRAETFFAYTAMFNARGHQFPRNGSTDPTRRMMVDAIAAMLDGHNAVFSRIRRLLELLLDDDVVREGGAL